MRVFVHSNSRQVRQRWEFWSWRCTSPSLGRVPARPRPPPSLGPGPWGPPPPVYHQALRLHQGRWELPGRLGPPQRQERPLPPPRPCRHPHRFGTSPSDATWTWCSRTAQGVGGSGPTAPSTLAFRCPPPMRRTARRCCTWRWRGWVRVEPDFGWLGCRVRVWAGVVGGALRGDRP